MFLLKLEDVVWMRKQMTAAGLAYLLYVKSANLDLLLMS